MRRCGRVRTQWKGSSVWSTLSVTYKRQLSGHSGSSGRSCILVCVSASFSFPGLLAGTQSHLWWGWHMVVCLGVGEMPDNLSGSSVDPYLLISGINSTEMHSVVVSCSEFSDGPPSCGLENVISHGCLQAFLEEKCLTMWLLSFSHFCLSVR